MLKSYLYRKQFYKKGKKKNKKNRKTKIIKQTCSCANDSVIGDNFFDEYQFCKFFTLEEWQDMKSLQNEVIPL